MNEKYKEGILLVVGCIALFVIALYAVYAYTGTILFILFNVFGISFQPFSVGLILVPVIFGMLVIFIWSYALVYGLRNVKISIAAAIISVPIILSVLTYIVHPFLLGLEAWPRMLISEVSSLFLFTLSPLIGVGIGRRYFIEDM